MQLTSTFVLAAVFALKATSVVAMPFSGADDVASVEARDVAYFDNEIDARAFDDEFELDAREFDDEFELEARDFDDEFELEARDFDDFEELQARIFSPSHAIAAARTVSKIPVRSGARIGGAHSLSGGGRLPGRLHTGAGADRRIGGVLRGGLRGVPRQGGRLPSRLHPGGTRGAGRLAGGRTGARVPGRVSRFENKIHSEASEMRSEENKIKAEEARLKKQASMMQLQETIHRDRQQLQQDGAF